MVWPKTGPAGTAKKSGPAKTGPAPTPMDCIDDTKTLKDMKTEERFSALGISAVKTAEDLGVNEPRLPRKRNVPERLERDESVPP